MSGRMIMVAVGMLLAAAVLAQGAEGQRPAAEPQVSLEKMKAAFAEVEKEVKPYTQPRSDLVNRLVMMRLVGIKDVDYETLVVVSGYGTSFAYHPKKYFALYQPADPPAETEERLARATGFRCEWLPKAKDAEDGWQVVKKAIDAGRPLQAAWYDDFLILGYQDAANVQDRRLFFMGDWDEPGWRPWAKFEEWCRKFGRLAQYAKAGQKATTRDIALDMLKHTVAYAEGDGRAQAPFGAGVKFGLAGIEAYAADVADATKAPDYFDAGWLGCHCAYRQITGRKCMAVYLRRVAPEFPKESAEHVLAAAKQYDAAWAAWQEWEKHLGKVEGRTNAEELKKVWAVEANRKAGAAAIRQAIQREKAAVAEIVAALKADEMTKEKMARTAKSGSRFCDMSLAGAEFDNVNLSKATFHNINMSDVTITAVQIGGALFKHIGPPPDTAGKQERQRPVTFEEMMLCDSTFRGVDMSNVKIVDCNLEGMTIDGIAVADLIAAYRRQKP